jgi:hypothetical protein
MLRLEHAGRRFALAVVASLVAGACSEQPLTAPTAELAVQPAPAAASAAAPERLTFKGRVTAVNETNQVGLANSTWIRVTGQTRIPPGSDVQSLNQLRVLVQQGAQIEAHGRGEIVSREPLVLAAVQVTFQQR